VKLAKPCDRGVVDATKTKTRSNEEKMANLAKSQKDLLYICKFKGRYHHSAVANYIEYMRIKGYAKATIKTQRELTQNFLDDICLPPKEITTRDIEEYRKRELARGISSNTMNHRLSIIRNFFCYLAKQGSILIDPAKKIEYAKKRQTLPLDILSEDQIKKALALPKGNTEQGKRLQAMLEVLYSTGIRRQELLNLNVEDVNLDQGLLIVREGKGKKDRVVPLGKSAVESIKNYLESKRRKSDVLFTSVVNGARFWTQTLDQIFKDFSEEVGFRVSGHKLRRTFATHIVKAGMPIAHLKDILGHSELKTMQRYVNLVCVDVKKEHLRCHPRG
jgi:integrase/recombinase XerD